MSLFSIFKCFASKENKQTKEIESMNMSTHFRGSILLRIYYFFYRLGRTLTRGHLGWSHVIRPTGLIEQINTFLFLFA